MSNEHEGKLIDEIIRRAKEGRDVSAWKNEKEIAPLLSVIARLNSVPTVDPELPDYDRVRAQIFQKIKSAEPEKKSIAASLYSLMPKMLKLGTGVVASAFVLVSLAVGTAAASLESFPGQPLYPLKTVVEKVQLKLASDETQRANLQIKFANNRLEELEKALEQNKQGKLSEKEVQVIVDKTVKDLQSTNTAITQSPTAPADKPVAILNKLVDLNNKQTALLQTAAIQSEGEVRIGLQKALEASEITKEMAIENIERAGLKIEEKPLTIEERPTSTDTVIASGKLTAVLPDSVSIGTAKFLLTSDTKYANITLAELKVGTIVDISGKIVDNKTYALEIAVKSDTQLAPEPTETPLPAPENQQ